MRVEKDFEDFLKLLKEEEVKYCIVGAYAISFHGYTRYTKDIDILVKTSVENARKMIKVIKRFFNDDLGLRPSDFTEKGRFVQLGYAPNRIDIMTSIPGVNFDTAWENKVIGIYGSVNVYFIGLDDLIRSKQIEQREQDKIDLKYLLRIREKQKETRK